jgi:hypothetical protein
VFDEANGSGSGIDGTADHLPSNDEMDTQHVLDAHPEQFSPAFPFA